MSVPGVFPAKTGVKMLLSRGRTDRGKQEEKEKTYWGRKTGRAPPGALGPNLGEGKKKKMEQIAWAKHTGHETLFQALEDNVMTRKWEWGHWCM